MRKRTYVWDLWVARGPNAFQPAKTSHPTEARSRPTNLLFTAAANWASSRSPIPDRAIRLQLSAPPPFSIQILSRDRRPLFSCSQKTPSVTPSVTGRFVTVFHSSPFSRSRPFTLKHFLIENNPSIEMAESEKARVSGESPRTSTPVNALPTTNSVVEKSAPPPPPSLHPVFYVV